MNFAIEMLQDLDEYKNLLKPRLKSIVQTEDREWFIVFISKAITDNAVKLCKKVYGKVEADFSSKKRERYSCATRTQLQRKVYVHWKAHPVPQSLLDSNIKTLNTILEKCFHACGCRCCKVELHGTDISIWNEIELKIVECIRNTLDRRIQYYEEEVRKLSENRFLPAWNFCNFFIVKVTYGFFSTPGWRKKKIVNITLDNLSCGSLLFSLGSWVGSFLHIYTEGMQDSSCIVAFAWVYAEVK